MIAGFQVHPAAELFPMMSDTEMAALIDDIRENGQDEPIELDADGSLIDGRNRAVACERLGVTPERKIFHGDVWQHVISRNLHRRHLNESQRAMIAAKLASRHVGRAIESIDPFSPPPTREEAAKALGVGTASTTRAKKVITKGTDGLQQLVSDGKATVNAAVKIADLPSDEQDAIVAKVLAGESIKPLVPKRPTHPKSQPKMGGNRRKHLGVLDAIVNSVSGAVMALDGVTELDRSVTAEEADRLMVDLSKQISALNRIRNLIKERTT